MREIKFRVWHDGYMCIPEEGGFSIQQDGELDYGEYYDSRDVSNAKVLLYTGFKDSNGKEIYEGDIVDFRYDSGWGIAKGIAEVEYDKILGWGYTFTDGEYVNVRDIEEDKHTISVIGNIYKNPKLLDD